MTTRFIFSLFFFLIVLPFGHAQKKKAWVEAADRAFQVEEDYYKAFKYYEAALMYTRDTSDVLRLLYQKAESARMFNAYLDAGQAYRELIARAPADSLLSGPYGCAWAYLGDIQLSLAYSGLGGMNAAHYHKAAEYFELYNNHFPNAGGPCAELAASGLEVIRFVQQEGGSALTNDSIDVKSAGPNINSRFSDFAAMPWGDRLYFTSYRNEIRQKGVKPSRYFSRIYLSENNGPADTVAGINLKPLDTLHVGHTAFNRDQDRIYFTLCEFVDRKLNTRCDLYYHNIDPEGKPVGDAVEVAELNLDDFTLTQPALSWDEELNSEVLYFVSDRPGTRGGMDIWKSELVNGKFSAPSNDLIINTSGNEMTPFEHERGFYFSSSGQKERYGGYDIFYTNDPESEPPVNLGQKINSSTDELYFSLNQSGTQAYFSSNRLASTTFEISEEQNDDKLKEACCLDIYTYSVPQAPPCILTVATFAGCGPTDDTNISGEKFPEAVVELFDITQGDPGRQIPGTKFTGARNNVIEFAGGLLENHKYRIVSNGAPKFGEKQIELDFTQGTKPCEDGPEHKDICFGCEKPLLTVEVYHNGLELRDVRLRMVEVNRPGSIGFNELATTGEQTETPLNRAVIPCPAGTNFYAPFEGERFIEPFSQIPIEFDRTYLLIADSKRDSLMLDTLVYTPNRADQVFQNEPCLQSVVLDLEVLPSLQLFFHNDKPDWPNRRPGTWRRPEGSRSAQPYLTTLDSYKNETFEEYLKRFPANSPNEQIILQRQELDLFFRNELSASERKLQELAEKATELLCQNVPVTIEIKGCASPKFNSPQSTISEPPINNPYNVALVNRRVESVEQNLKRYGLTEEKWQNLYTFKRTNEPCSRVVKDPNITIDQLQDQKDNTYSVFSIDASIARRVELKLRIGPRDEN